MSTMLQRGEHGSASTWRQGCRCADCRRARNRSAQLYTAVSNMRRGREPASLVPARRVVRHVNELRAAGMPMVAIAEHAGVATVTLHRACRPRARITRIVERLVLGVELPATGDTWAVDPAPLIAHLEELRAAGVGGLRRVAALAGVDRTTLQRARRGERVTAAVVRRVLAVPAVRTSLVDPAHLPPIGDRDRPADRSTAPGM